LFNEYYQIACFWAISAAMSEQPTGEAYEEEHVHTVYEQIASHFSSTRYKVRSVYLTATNSYDRMLMCTSAMANY